jgi:poly(A) polymerase
MSTLREGALAVVDRLRRRGHTAYWVGGCVRDLEMGREPHDYDIATDARPEAVAALFDHAVMVGAKFGVVAVSAGEHQYEVTTFRSEGPYLDGRRPSQVEFVGAEADVQRRDFTINGLLHDPAAGRTIDYVGGREDIARRRVRTIGDAEARFAEDRLRMLRAIRLAAELEFTIEEETWRAIVSHAPAIRQVSTERIRDELTRLVCAPGRGAGIRHFLDSGLLGTILPEVAAMVGVAQPPEFHPEGDVFTHTVLVLEKLRDPTPLRGIAALLHDVGKPPTYSETDRIRFSGHNEVGAAMAEAVCRRLRFSNEDTARIVSLVREHIWVKDLPRMRPAKVKRFLTRDDVADHLELHRADCLASHGDLSVWEFATGAQRALTEEEIRPPRLLTGDDLKELGYPPGPRFKQILEAVLDAQLEGRVRSREEALAMVRREFPPGFGEEPGAKRAD